MTNCSLQMAVLADALEAGSQPWPIFFAGQDCNVSQWPSAGEPLQPSLYGNPFNARGQACLKENGNPDDVVSTTNGGKSFLETIPIFSCPIPVIFSMIIPNDMKVTFYTSAVTSSSVGKYVRDPGQLTLATSSNNNILYVPPIDDASQSTYKWQSSKDNTGVCQQDNGTSPNYPDQFNGYDHNARPFFDVNTLQMTQSNQSCGYAFWPTLTSVQWSGTELLRNPNGLAWALVGRDVDWADYAHPGYYCKTIQNGTRRLTPGGQASGNARRAGGCTCYEVTDGTDLNITGYQTADCMLGETGAAPDGADDVICKSRDCSVVCRCNDLNRQANGSVQNIKIEYTDSNNWDEQRFLYCIGRQKLSIGGIPIQRYGNGTVACDDIVPQFCANTAFLIANDFAEKACACINEQARLELQFQGLDLPVQCFSDVCSNADPQVYKTGNQLKGCSARLCVQILTINGSAIADEGFQTLTCDGVVYNVNNQTTNTTPVPVSTSTPGGPGLGIVFYVALGLLVFVVILLVIFFVRRFVIQKRKQNRQNQLIVKSFENVLKK